MTTNKSQFYKTSLQIVLHNKILINSCVFNFFKYLTNEDGYSNVDGEPLSKFAQNCKCSQSINNFMKY